MDSNFSALMYGVGMPLVVCLAGLWLIWRGSPRTRGEAGAFDPFGPGVRSAVLFGVVLPAALLLGFTRPGVPPASATDWVIHFAWLGGLVGVVGAVLAPRRPRATPTRAGLSVFVVLHLVLVGLVLGALRTQFHGEDAPAAVVSALAIGVVGACISLGFRSAASRPGAIAPILVVLVCLCASIATVLTGNIAPSVQLGTLCACVGPGFVVALRRPGVAIGAALTGPAWLLTGLCIVTTAIGQTPWWCARLVAVAALMVYFSGFGPLGRLRGARAWLVRLALVGGPGIGAIIVALMNQPAAY